MARQTFYQTSDYFHPGSPNDSRLFHADSSDQIRVCLPPVGQGYKQIIPLQEGLSLVILDYKVHSNFLSRYPQRSQFLEFEFRIAGPLSGHSIFYPPQDPSMLVGIWQTQQRRFNIEVTFSQPFLMPYLSKVFEHLTSQDQNLIYTLIDWVYRSQLGYAAVSPQAVLTQILSGAVVLPKLFKPDPLLKNPKLWAFGNMQRLMTPEMHQVIHQILSCPYSGRVRRVYLERKALKLVALKLNALHQSRVLSYPLNSDDLDGIYEAGKILASQYQHPPSVEALARQVGLNRLKLNQGFHHVYGTTPFRYLRNFRIELARYLLTNSELAVEEVAYRVGYTSRTSFSGAFCHQFGLSPKTFQLQTVHRLQQQDHAS